MYYRNRYRGPHEWFWAAVVLLFGFIIIVIFLMAVEARRVRLENPVSLFQPTATRQVTAIPTIGVADSQRPVQAVPAATTPSASTVNGETAPDFTLTTLAGDTVSLSDFSGQPIIINFWASWCAPCREEMPALIRAYERYQDRGLVVLAVNMTFQDDMDAVRDFVDEFNLPFPALLDDNGTVTNDLYHVLGVPTSYFVTPGGTLQTEYIGAMTEDDIFQFSANLFSDS